MFKLFCTSQISEVLGALLSITIIWVLTGILVFLAVKRVIDQDYEIDANAMLITSAAGVIVNIMYFFKKIFKIKILSK